MRVLALDTTTRAGSVAIEDDGRLLVQRVGDPSRSHAERLPGDVLGALAEVQLSSADVDLFAVAAGPGSFTGLRIGIATIQGLAFVHRRRVAPVSALRALADIGSPLLPHGARVGAWMDAHRRDVFSALYAVDGAAPDGRLLLSELEGPSVGPPADTLRRWEQSWGLPAAVCGDGGVIYAAVLPPDVAIIDAPPLAATIAALARIAHQSDASVDPAGVQPLYVRRPDAELARDSVRVRR
jgi:tRNA threonylcarbamoyladenosine biosynthesis protein TsaB